VPRIVSLLASSTEIVAALGFEQDLVGRSHECDHPPSVRALPVCTEPKFPVEGTSREIDARVRTLVAEALSVYRVKTDVLGSLRPDLIVTQSQCEVCAVSLKDVEEAVCALTASRPRIVSLEPNALADVWRDIGRVGAALGVPERGDDLVRRLQERMDAIAARARARSARPTVACIEWIDPLMAAGNWMPELVAIAGGVSLFGEAGRHAPAMSFEELVGRDPEVIVVLPCGFDLERTARDLPALAARPGWNRLRAVSAGRVALADGNQYFNRPGPRLVESLEVLAEILHPEVFDFGHRGSGWRPWQPEQV
jgi:iron complex transport system substrate-binding protein